MWSRELKSFSDAQFPNLGYTYLINLGNPFTMQVEDQRQRIKTEGFLPRYHAIESFHRPGDHLFGIKFRISPVIFQKRINFSEYKNYVYPLSYLLEPAIIASLRSAAGFDERIGTLSRYFRAMLNNGGEEMKQVTMVSQFLDECFQQNDFHPSLEKHAKNHHISTRTLQRYFQACTGITAKQALQVMRIRKALGDIIRSRETFDHSRYGYYDHSHFYKHLREFLARNTFGAKNLHLQFLA